MNITKKLSVVSAVMMLVSMFGTAANANYSVSDTDGTITWDFAEYTTKTQATGNTTYATEPIDYNGLEIYLANDNKNDYVFTDGVHFGGKYAVNSNDENSSTGSSAGRYIAYTPEVSGKLCVTGKMLNRSTNRWGIIESLGGNFDVNQSTDNKTSSATVSAECSAGKTYYIYGRDNGITVSNVKFVPNEYVTAEQLSSVSGTDGSVADVFYCTEHLAEGTSFTSVDVTVNNVTKNLATPTMSGNGSIRFGVVVSYDDGTSKGYTPSFKLK